MTDAKAWAKEQVRLMNEAEKEDAAKFNIELCAGTDLVMDEQKNFKIFLGKDPAINLASSAAFHDTSIAETVSMSFHDKGSGRISPAEAKLKDPHLSLVLFC